MISFSKGLKMFSLPHHDVVVLFFLCKHHYSPAASFVDDVRSLRTIKAVFVWEEGFDAACVLKDDK